MSFGLSDKLLADIVAQAKAVFSNVQRVEARDRSALAVNRIVPGRHFQTAVVLLFFQDEHYGGADPAYLA